MRTFVVLAAAATIAGCGSPPDPDAQRAGDVELSTRAINRALGAETLFISMGVIATNMPANVNASALYQRVMNETNGCANATLSGTSLDIDFGTGCVLASTNVVYQGSLHADVSVPAQGQILVATTLNLVVDGGQPLSGTVNITTSDGTTYTYSAGLTFGGVVVSAPNLQVGIANYGATFNVLSGMLMGATGVYALTVTGVHQRFAGCYADDGQLEIMAPTMGMTAALDEFWNFMSQVPQNGIVNVGLSADDMSPKMISLPARMGCPTGVTASM
jgi:hypothetical protein